MKPFYGSQGKLPRRKSCQDGKVAKTVLLLVGGGGGDVLALNGTVFDSHG